MRTFEEFNKEIGNCKTGGYGHGVDMYTKRDGSNLRVFRVQWYERNSKYPTHADWKKALNLARQGWHPRGGLGNEWVEKNQTFPYSEDGLAAAIAFSESIQPMWEAFWNREDD